MGCYITQALAIDQIWQDKHRQILHLNADDMTKALLIQHCKDLTEKIKTALCLLDGQLPKVKAGE